MEWIHTRKPVVDHVHFGQWHCTNSSSRPSSIHFNHPPTYRRSWNRSELICIASNSTVVWYKDWHRPDQKFVDFNLRCTSFIHFLAHLNIYRTVVNCLCSTTFVEAPFTRFKLLHEVTARDRRNEDLLFLGSQPAGHHRHISSSRAP